MGSARSTAQGFQALPKRELVIANHRTKKQSARGYTLAYKFDIYAVEPLSRSYVYVDAHDGSIVASDAIIKHSDSIGTAATHYSGNRTINTELIGSTYYLHDKHAAME